MDASPAMTRQLALAIQLNDEATFADFCWGDNDLLHLQLQQTLQGEGERLYYIWGCSGSGKSHLLQAICQSVDSHQSSIYLPLKILQEWGPQVIEGLNEQSIICIDDINSIAGQINWEEALFHLYNRVRDAGQGILIITGSIPPTQIELKLADLRSRLCWGLIWQVHELSDEDKVKTLQLHAHKRGFELPLSVGQFLLSRCSRNMHDLHVLLNKLDQASLIAQRKITIPFVKEILAL